jgi:hypothetical protein
MPTVFRSMRMAADGFPIVARSTSGLGVRVPGMIPPAQKVDVDVDANGDVIANNKGISVNPGWKDILPNFLPMRCGGFARNNRFCFKMGDGPFVQGAFAAGLELIPDSPKHGVVAPDQNMPLADYEAHLAATRLLWEVDES